MAIKIGKGKGLESLFASSSKVPLDSIQESASSLPTSLESSVESTVEKDEHTFGIPSELSSEEGMAFNHSESDAFGAEPSESDNSELNDSDHSSVLELLLHSNKESSDVESEDVLDESDSGFVHYANASQPVDLSAEDSEQKNMDESSIDPSAIQYVDIYKVEPDPDQPRHRFDPVSLKELSQSIQQYGLLQPLLVTKKDGYYKIVAGERRYRAARLAGLTSIPVLVKDYEDEQRKAVALIENLQRQDLNPMEESDAYCKLMKEYGLTQEQLSQRLGKNRATIANSLRLQNLPQGVKESIGEGLLSLGHAKVLLSLSDAEEQNKLALRVISENLSVRDLEDIIRNEGKTTKGKKKTPSDRAQEAKPQTLAAKLAQKRIHELCGTKVRVEKKNDKVGLITIEYYSEEDLERIVSLFEGGADNE